MIGVLLKDTATNISDLDRLAAVKMGGGIAGNLGLGKNPDKLKKVESNVT